ncbi:cytochrome oxidase biogenesis protein Sco1/SenC/PrrC [Gracilibacillus boraciitolerans JCM 21714]|uniref:Cytochrome oxidase biogenesis protein Sco1/SenC/PrrC n=1 Tax=Gracilibacillus boraciitolerans JCM 21714 TaxID=1298598 RepID=W4VF34_9BACI|nr:SCO family protein [Gracilibacillus boraciitolerans]GAE91822.1 cytochrome oxidase biogenesis protein Sco1/SenC/PrrC [Gracilibacillus boraciitolerans JCM 21714]
MLRNAWFVLLFIMFLTACGGNNILGNNNQNTNKVEEFSYEVEDFTFTNQDGEEFSKSVLEGKFWIADMIFTNCETVCPPMTANMARLQRMLEEENIDAELVSFSVDPTNDSPEILKDYIEKRGGTFDNWNALTGYSDDEIKSFAINSFKAFIEKPENNDQVIHVKTFYLVTPDGKAIKRYDGEKADNMEKIVEDIKAMN